MLSFEDRQQKLRAALEQKYPRREGQYEAGPWLVATFEDVTIVQRDGKLWRLPYTLTEAQDVTLGELELVEVTYEPVTESIGFGASQDKTGAVWAVRVLRLGRSGNGWLWTRESAEALLPHLEGSPIGCYVYANGVAAHAQPEAIVAAQGPVARNLVGHLTKPRLAEDGVYAEAHIHEDAPWLRKKLLALERGGVLGKTLGLSVDTLCGFVPVQVREGAARWIREVKKLFSTDIVTAPSADGRFIRATAGPLLMTNGEDDNMWRTKLIALIKEHRPQLLEGRAVESLTDQELEGVAREALTPALTGNAAQITLKIDQKIEGLTQLERRLAIRDSEARVREALAGTQLPQPIKDKIARQFTGRVAEAAEIAAAIKDEQDTYALLHPATPPASGGGRVEILAAPADKIQAGLDRLFGVDPDRFARALESAPFSAVAVARVRENLGPSGEAHKDRGLDFQGSLRRAYVALTGDDEIRGFLVPGRASEAITTTTWANLLANTLYRRLLQDYAAANYNERSIAEFGRATDFRTRESVSLNYFADLAEFDPQQVDYPNIVEPGDSKVSYAVTGRGGILTITRATIVNDDVGAVSRMMERLGRAARRTLARFIWNFWVANAAYDVDGLAWFHATHANTGSTALTAALAGATEVLAKIIQLADMTEPGSAEKLGMPPMESLWLDVPHALYGVAKQINDSPEFGSGNVNPVLKHFGERGERINVNPLFTDATDWGVHVAPAAGGRESVRVDFLNGREEPEFFLADQPTVGQTFVGDKIQMKVRHEYGGDVQEFRGATKNVVAG